VKTKTRPPIVSQNVLAAILAGMFLFTLATTALTQTQSIRGEVIDVECYVAQGAKGESHKQCAIACIKGGQPAGIREENTGKIYLVVTEDHATPPSEKIMPFIAKMVVVDGTVKERGGISIIDIKSIKEIGSPEPGETAEKKEPKGY
jgi:hypothetical protein